MEIDPLNTIGEGDSARDTGNSRTRYLNTWVAVSVALLATFMGICKIKDDNIVQAMQQAQADRVDHWGYYQARNVRQEVAQGVVDQLELSAESQPEAARARSAPVIARYKSLVAEQKAKKDSVRAQAEQDQKTYDGLNFHDDQFDLADALIAIAISLMALTSLTQRRWLFFVALVAAVFGVIMGVSGLFGLQIHPDALSSLLS